MYVEVDLETKEFFGSWLGALQGELKLIRKVLHEIKNKIDAKEGK